MARHLGRAGAAGASAGGGDNAVSEETTESNRSLEVVMRRQDTKEFDRLFFGGLLALVLLYWAHQIASTLWGG